MNAAFISETGDPEVIQYGDLPDPEPHRVKKAIDRWYKKEAEQIFAENSGASETQTRPELSISKNLPPELAEDQELLEAFLLLFVLYHR